MRVIALELREVAQLPSWLRLVAAWPEWLLTIPCSSFESISVHAPRLGIVPGTSGGGAPAAASSWHQSCAPATLSQAERIVGQVAAVRSCLHRIARVARAAVRRASVQRRHSHSRPIQACVTVAPHAASASGVWLVRVSPVAPLRSAETPGVGSTR